MTTDILPLSPAMLPKALIEMVPPAAVIPNARQVNGFERLMNAAKAKQHASEALQKMPIFPIQPGAVAPLSENTALLGAGALQSQGQEIRKRFRPDAVTDAQDAAAALRIQGDIAIGMLRLELLTKVANGIAQGINKLTSMA